jgi:hypothetical protein
MFFLIRCVFWLWVVFSTIFSPDRREPPAPPQAQAQAQAQTIERAKRGLADIAQTWIDAAASLLARQAVDRCVATSCLQSPDAGHFLGVKPMLQAKAWGQANVPLPPRRPIFKVQKAGLAGLEKSSRAEYVTDHSGRS